MGVWKIRRAECPHNEPGEEWRPVVGFGDRYLISSLGRVWSCVSEKMLAPRIRGQRGKGYPFVIIRKESAGQNINKSVHIMVAEAFIGPRPEGLFVSHLDGNSHNPAAANLIYETCTENNRRKRGHGTSRGLRKLTREQAREVYRTFRSGCRWNGAAALAEKFGVNVSVIRYIANGTQYTDWTADLRDRLSRSRLAPTPSPAPH